MFLCMRVDLGVCSFMKTASLLCMLTLHTLTLAKTLHRRELCALCVDRASWQIGSWRNLTYSFVVQVVGGYCFHGAILGESLLSKANLIGFFGRWKLFWSLVLREADVNSWAHHPSPSNLLVIDVDTMKEPVYLFADSMPSSLSGTLIVGLVSQRIYASWDSLLDEVKCSLLPVSTWLHHLCYL